MHTINNKWCNNYQHFLFCYLRSTSCITNWPSWMWHGDLKNFIMTHQHTEARNYYPYKTRNPHRTPLCFFSLKHFGHFQLRHFGHWSISTICLTIASKLTVKVFCSLCFQTFCQNDFIFFGHFKNISVYDRKKTAPTTCFAESLLKSTELGARPHHMYIFQQQANLFLF